MDGTGLVVYGLAVWRLSTMIVKEEGPFEVFARCRAIVGAESEGVPNAWDELGTAGKLLQCPYCLSVWIALLFLVIYMLNKRVFNVFSTVLFGSAVTALIEDYYASNAYT